MAREGLTDEQIAGKIGISHQTLYEWCRRFPAFSDALKQGKAPVDQEVENALLKRAMGYQYEETITEVEEIPTGRYDDDGKPIMKQVKHIRKVQKTALPDTTAQIFWLKNRRPDRWREKQEIAGNINLTAGDVMREAFEEMQKRAQEDDE